jgi:hypothetical protein
LVTIQPGPIDRRLLLAVLRANPLVTPGASLRAVNGYTYSYDWPGRNADWPASRDTLGQQAMYDLPVVQSFDKQDRAVDGECDDCDSHEPDCYAPVKDTQRYDQRDQ